VSALGRLSSASGDRSEASNKAVALEALARPEILAEVAVGLDWKDPKLLGDCAEVFTEVAKVDPTLVAPYTGRIIPLTSHRNTRVRWESTHALALVASLVPEQVAPLLPDLLTTFERDMSVIVRDCVVLTLGEYGKSSPERAKETFPHLEWALWQWEGKHAKLVLEAMVKLVDTDPSLKPELQSAATECLDHYRANVRKLAIRLAQ
jgi:hypothetical protein